MRRRLRQSSAGSGIELAGGGRKRVLNGGVQRVKLAGEIGLGDHVVVRRERVPLEAERADPDLGCLLILPWRRCSHGLSRCNYNKTVVISSFEEWY